MENCVSALHRDDQGGEQGEWSTARNCNSHQNPFICKITEDVSTISPTTTTTMITTTSPVETTETETTTQEETTTGIAQTTMRQTSTTEQTTTITTTFTGVHQ